MVFNVWKAALLVLALLPGVAEAALKAGPNVAGPGAHHRLLTPSTGPLGTAPTPTTAYSFRKLISGATLSAKLSRNSDSTTLDVGFTAAGDADMTAINAFCSSTTCHLATWYDQSGAGRHLIGNGTVSFQPTITFSCIPGGGGVCAGYGAATVNMAAAASFTPATGLVSISGVHKRPTGTGICVVLAENGLSNNRIQTRSPTGFTLLSSSGQINVAIDDTIWRTAIGVNNGASSGLTIDGATTTGTVTGNTNAVPPYLGGAASTTCYIVEAIFWDNYAMSAADIASLNASQHAYWGF